MNKRGISNLLSYVALTIVILSIGSFMAYFFIYQTRVTSKVITSELEKEEGRILEKISLIYWGPNYCILSNDGEIKVTIKKIYVDDNIISLDPPIVIYPHEKKEFSVPYGKNLMIETLSGSLFKFVKKEFTIMEKTWIENLPSEIIITSYIPTIFTSICTITKTITSYAINITNHTFIQTIEKGVNINPIPLKFIGSIKHTFLIVLCFINFSLKSKMKNKRGFIYE
jgi:hypothetical protein